MNISNFTGKKNGNSDPAGTDKTWYSLVSNASSRHVDIYLYGIIGGWNVNVQQLLAELKAAGKVDTITVYLNTIGGIFYDGLPIYNTLKQHPAHVTVKVMGYALSMGSIVMLAGDAVEAAENSIIMIHRPQGGMNQGDVDDVRKLAEMLEKHEAAVLPEYMRRMGKTEDEVRALLKAETWYTAAEAQAAGLIDTIIGKTDLDPQAAGASMQGDSWEEYISQHYPNIPSNISTFIQAQSTPAGGTMKQADINAIAEAVAQKLQLSNAAPAAPAGWQADKLKLETENQRLMQANKALSDELEEYTVPDPALNTQFVPENTRPISDSQEYKSRFM